MVTFIATQQNINIRVDENKTVINKKKNEKLFDEVVKRANSMAVDKFKEWLRKNFNDLKSQVENKSQGLMSVENNKVYIKGTTTPVPGIIVKKLEEISRDGGDIQPLIRFWLKLAENPSLDSVKDLYEFMTHNNIPITEQGDILVEKGVNQKKGSYFGDLVDCRTNTISNNIGTTVTMPREKVDSDRKQTCSAGLHVGAPDYVRNNWKSDVILECVVNPKDVVSVPTDYNATKMRVCEYRVVGYSDRSRVTNKVVKLSDFLTTPPADSTLKMKEKANPKKEIKKQTPKKETVMVKEPSKTTVKNAEKLIEGMTAREIVDYVESTTGDKITISLKSKKSIEKKAIKALTTHLTKEGLTKVAKMAPVSDIKEIPVEAEIVRKPLAKQKKELDLVDLSRKELKEIAKSKFNETFSFLTTTASIKHKLINLALDAGYIVKQ